MRSFGNTCYSWALLRWAFLLHCDINFLFTSLYFTYRIILGSITFACSSRSAKYGMRGKMTSSVLRIWETLAWWRTQLTSLVETVRGGLLRPTRPVSRHGPTMSSSSMMLSLVFLRSPYASIRVSSAMQFVFSSRVLTVGTHYPY